MSTAPNLLEHAERFHHGDVDLASTNESDTRCEYRPLSGFAVLSLVLGGVAILPAVGASSIHPGWLSVFPAFGLISGRRALRNIRRYEQSGRKPAWAGIALSTACLVGGWAWWAYSYATESPPGYARISYDLLQSTPGHMVPDTAAALDGQRVFIKGYMYPSRQMTGITQFVLCRDNGSCCFGGQPKLTDMINVKMQGPLTMDYHPGLRQVAGVFHVQSESALHGLGDVLYQLEAEYAK